MPQPVASATKQNLLMAVAITVHIAKLNSVRAAEEECLCAQIRYGLMRVQGQAAPKLSISYSWLVNRNHITTKTDFF